MKTYGDCSTGVWVLRDIPALIEICLWLESKSDIEFLKEQHEVT